MYRKYPLLFVAALMGFLSPSITLAKIADINATADVNYSQSKSTTDVGVTSSTWGLTQNYRLLLSKPLTRTITFNGDVSLTITDRKDSERRERIFPFFFLSFSPPSFARDWYNLRFGHSRTLTAPSEAANITTANTNVSLNLPFKRWPALSLSYNRSTSQDDLDPHRLDSITERISLQTNYGFNFLETQTRTSYSFNLDITEDKVSETKTERPQHTVSVSSSRKFWKDKISTSANLGFGYTESTTESLGAPQRFQTGLTANQGVSSIFTGPSFDATDPSFINNALIDGNIGASVNLNLDAQSSNIVIKFDTAQALNSINLNITTALTKAVIDTLNFGWQLFISDDGISWTSLGTQFPVYEEIPSKRFVFSFSERTARFFRLVNTNAPNTGSPIEVTEMAGLGFILATPSQSFTRTETRNFGGFSISYSPTGALRMSYSISYGHNRSKRVGTDADSTSLSQSVSLGYSVIPKYLNLAAGFATASSKSTGSETSRSDSYNLTLSSSPLPTLAGSLGLRRSESSSGGDKVSRNDSLTANVSMRLYRGVDLSIRNSFNESTSFISDSTTQSLNLAGDLRLQPWTPLTISFNGLFSRNDGSTTETLSSSFSLRLTRKIVLSGTASILPESSQSFNVSWALSRNIQTSARLSLSENSKNLGASLSWRPLRRLRLSLNYNGTRSEKTDAKSDSFSARASLRF
jgi:hypothetical protein